MLVTPANGPTPAPAKVSKLLPTSVKAPGAEPLTLMFWLLLARVSKSSSAVMVNRPAANDVVTVPAGTTRPSSTSMPGTKRLDPRGRTIVP